VLESRTTLRNQLTALWHPRQSIQAAWRDEAVRFSILVFGVLRLVTGIVVLIMVHNVAAPPPVWLAWNPSGQTYADALPLDAPLATVVEPWRRWDTAWYIKIAIQGYHQGDTAIVFPPLYPVLIALVALFCAGNYVLASLLVSNAACLIAFILLFRLVVTVFGSVPLARRTLVCLAIFPTAFYLVAGYSESLFLALTLGAFLAALNRQWLFAGILAGLAALARLQGAILLIPLGWIAYVQLRESGLPALVARLPALVGAPAGAIAYIDYVAINKLGYLETAYTQEWQLSTRLPWEVVQSYLDRRASGIIPDFENDNAFALAVLAVLGLVVLIRFRPAFSLYVWTNLVVVLLRYHEGPQLESLFRYALLFFPCFIAAAMILRRWWLIVPVAVFTIYWQCVLLDRFVHWIWVA
jgi:Gpi18-like mannosyltransferase